MVGGLLFSGVLREGDPVHIGPTSSGKFESARLYSIHRYKVPCRVVRAGESGTLALHGLKSDVASQLRKGMVLLMPGKEPRQYPVCLFFQARMHVLYHATVIAAGFQATVHIGHVCQTAIVIAIMGKKGITTNETASVMFKFFRQPEYIKPGSRVLFREGRTKCIGRIVQIFPVVLTDKEPEQN